MLVPRASTPCYQLQWDIPASEGLEDSKGLNNVQQILASCLKGIYAGLFHQSWERAVWLSSSRMRLTPPPSRAHQSRQHTPQATPRPYRPSRPRKSTPKFLQSPKLPQKRPVHPTEASLAPLPEAHGDLHPTQHDCARKCGAQTAC
jgi:hypothetical protein